MSTFAELHADVVKHPRDLTRIAALLRHVRTSKLRVSDVVAKYGAAALDLGAPRRLGDEVWSVYEQTLLAALDVDDPALRDRCQSAILERFGGAAKPSQRVERLRGLVAEAAGDWDAAAARYASLLETNATNQQALKREICLLKGRGAPRKEVAEALNGYLVKFQSDGAAWQALGETHLAAARYADAIFCYEELTLFEPLSQHYFRRLGELHYSWAASLGAAKAEAKYRDARKYFAKSLELHATGNARAAVGLLLTCAALKVVVRGDKPDGDDEMNAALGQVAASHLKAAYAEAPAFLKEANHKLLAANAPPYARLLKKKEKKVEPVGGES